LEAQGGASAYYKTYRQRRKINKLIDLPASVHRVVCGKEASRFVQNELSECAAKSDAKIPQPIVMAGKYLLVPEKGANRDAIFIELRVITEPFSELQRTTDFSCDVSEVTVEG
jgi:hypothetical protein